MTLLDIKDLSVSIDQVKILDSVSFKVEQGQVVALVGESGSGKSITAGAMMQLLPEGAKCTGAISLFDENLLHINEKAMCKIRASKMGMIFQEPMTALNPVQSIGSQVMEAVKLSEPDLGRKQVKEKAEFALHRAGIDLNHIAFNSYPHTLSGGQRQRVVIAIAISQKPKLLIADEPTTALDVTTQAKILALVKKLIAQDEMGLLLISHDLAVVAEVADFIVIMKDGKIVEQGSTADFFKNMQQEYTKKLVEASGLFHNRNKKTVEKPKVEEIILNVKKINKYYKMPKQALFEKHKSFRVVNNAYFKMVKGENIGLVGESGCGKSTLSRLILGLEPIDSGEIHINGKKFSGVGDKEQRTLRKHINIVFQDPYSSFNPRHRVETIVSEPFYLADKKISKLEKRQKVEQMLNHVGLKSTDADKYPHEFSGGQRQRIAIARALITEPSIIILDEATSALDVLIRKQILELLDGLSKKLGISYLFISHDLSTVRDITNRIMVMKDGLIVEQGPTEVIFNNPKHPYTKTLLAATPTIERALKARGKE
jgi:peptide/nickel transport system ATP-binding protein